MNDVPGCEGCKQEIIKNRDQKYYVNENAKQYTEKKRINTVVYFDGKDFQFCEEEKFITTGCSKSAIVAYHIL